MGTTTRVKGEMGEKKPFNFALFWDKYGTFFILAIIVAIFGTLSSEYFLTTNNITQIFVQSSVTVLIGMGEFFAILVAGIDLSVGAILALSGMVTAKLMLAGVDPFLAALIGGVLVGGALGAINGCLVNWTGLHPFIITLGTNAIFRGITLVISDANSVYGFSFDFVNFFAATPLGIQAARRMARNCGGTASDELCLLVVLNTASIQLLPVTIAAVREAAGAAVPFDILPAVWVTSLCSVTVGLLTGKCLSRVWQ